MNASSNMPAITNPAYPGVLMSNGSRGPSVAVMQEHLNMIRTRFPSLPLLAVDGAFGPITEGAVRTFQALMNITSNGIIGPITWDYIVSVRNAVSMGQVVRADVDLVEAESEILAETKDVPVVKAPMQEADTEIKADSDDVVADASSDNNNNLLGLLLTMSLFRRPF